MKTKKGFTIVELVIVIAVIAVLAAVLIPTFSSLIEKAKVSSDTSVVKNVNQVLLVEEVSKGKKTNIADALADAEKGGYTVEKITPTSSGDIIWNEETNRFALVKDNNVIFGDDSVNDLLKNQKSKLWKISDKYETDGYSYYVTNGEIGTELTVSSGVYLNEDSSVTKLTYKHTGEENSASLYTNSKIISVVVNAPKDTVKHYGLAKDVTIEAVANHSYEEYGEIMNNVEIKQGRFYAGKTAVINGLLASPSDNASDTVILAADSDATINGISLNYGSEGTTNIKTTDLPEKHKNNIQQEIAKDVLDKLIEIGKTKFAGGQGTMRFPFLIETYEHLRNMSIYENTKYYFKQTKDIIVTSKDLFRNSIPFKGVYDGDNHKITLANDLVDFSSVCLFKAGESIEVRNLELYSAENCLASVIGFDNATKQNVGTIKLYNVNTYSVDNKTIKVKESNAGLFIKGHLWFPYDEKKTIFVTIDKCNNFANVENTSTCTGVFWGGCFYYGYDRDVELIYTVKDSNNYGNILSDDQAGLIFGNTAGIGTSYGLKKYSFEELTSMIKIENVKNYGILKTLTNTPGLFSNSNLDITNLNNYYENKMYNKGEMVVSNELTGKKFNVYYNEGNFYLDGDINDKYDYKLELILPNVAQTVDSSAQGRRYSIPLTKGTNGKQLTFDGNFNCLLSTEESKLLENGIDPESIKYDYLFENEYYMGHVFSKDKLSIIINITEQSEFPHFIDNSGKIDKKSFSNSTYIYAYDKDGSLKGKVKLK